MTACDSSLTSDYDSKVIQPTLHLCVALFHTLVYCVDV